MKYKFYKFYNKFIKLNPCRYFFNIQGVFIDFRIRKEHNVKTSCRILFANKFRKIKTRKNTLKKY